MAAVAAMLVVVLAGWTLWAGAAITVRIGGVRVPTLRDDAFIYLRYARHVARGQGLVWNPGEPPMDAVANLAWTYLAAAAERMGIGGPWFLLVVNAVLHAGLVLAVASWFLSSCRDGVRGPGGAILALVLAATSPPLLFESLSGMGHVLFAAAIAAAAAVSRRRRALAALLAGSLVWIRPEGAWIGAVLLAGVLLDAWRCCRVRARLYPLVLAWLLPVAAHLAFRLGVLGELLPNTYWLKVGGREGVLGAGVRYLAGLFTESWWAPAALGVAVWGAVRAWRARDPLRGALAAVALGIVPFVALQGGDIWPEGRFLVPLAVAGAIFGGEWLDALSARQGVARIRQGVLVAVLLGAQVATVARVREGWLLHPAPLTSTAQNLRLGWLLQRITEPDALLADFWGGATPWASDRACIDMLGKSDRHIARLPAHASSTIPGHNKWDFDYVLRRRPDVILGNLGHARALDPAVRDRVRSGPLPYGVLLFEHPGFLDQYRVLPSRLSYGWRGIYVRRDSNRVRREAAAQAEEDLMGP